MPLPSSVMNRNSAWSTGGGTRGTSIGLVLRMQELPTSLVRSAQSSFLLQTSASRAYVSWWPPFSGVDVSAAESWPPECRGSRNAGARSWIIGARSLGEFDELVVERGSRELPTSLLVTTAQPCTCLNVSRSGYLSFGASRAYVSWWPIFAAREVL